MADTTFVDQKEPRIEADWLNDVNDVVYTTFNGSAPTPTDSNFLVGDGSGFVAESGATARTSLGAQAQDDGLDSIAGLTTAADKMIYTTASDTYAVTDLTSAGRALIDDASASAQRTTLGLGNASTFDEATQANQEAETADKIVCSDTQHHHPTAAKFWVKFQADATIDGSYNVSSIDDDGTGDFGVNFSTSFSDANWSAHCDVTSGASQDYVGRFDGQSAGAAEVITHDVGGTVQDPTRIHVMGFGDQ